MNDATLQIFAKAPIAGFAKTRLIPELGEQGAAALALKMLRHTLAEALKLKVSVELCVSPGPEHAIWGALDLPFRAKLWDQGQGELGERLARGSARALLGSNRVFLIGSDCVEMNADVIREAYLALESSDAVLAPTWDGGYALFGFKKFEASLFENIAWSSPAVAQQTKYRIEALGWSLTILPTLQDIDEPADLASLPDGWMKA